MSTCTKDITLVVDPEVCPPGGTPPYYSLWFRLRDFPFDLVLEERDIGEGPIYYITQNNGDGNVFVVQGDQTGLNPNWAGLYIFPDTITGTLPITWSLVGNPPPWLTCDPNTGEITMAIDNVDDIGDKFEFVLRATNACGTLDSYTFRVQGGTVVYWGEWIAPEPVSFTASQIQNDLLDAYNTPSLDGPRICPIYSSGVGSEPQYPYGVQYFAEWGTLVFPDTTPTSYIRVFAVPHGFFSGTSNWEGWTSLDSAPPAPFTFKETITMTVGGLPTQYDIYTSPGNILGYNVGAVM